MTDEVTPEQKARQVVATYLEARIEELHSDEMPDALTFVRAMRAGISIEPPPPGSEDPRIYLSANNPTGLQRLLIEAETDAEAWDACQEIAVTLRARSESVPAPLADFRKRAARGEIKRPSRSGPDPRKNAARNLIIALAVDLADKHLPAYRHGEGKGVTACVLVSDLLKARGLKISPDAVENAWEKFRSSN